MASNTLDLQKRYEHLWATLAEQPVPSLHYLGPLDRDRFELLDLYLRDCLEEWCAQKGVLSAHSIVLLDACIRALTERFAFLDGEARHSFGQLRRLAKRILRDVNVEQATHIASLERAADTDLVPFFGGLPRNLSPVVEKTTRS